MKKHHNHNRSELNEGDGVIVQPGHYTDAPPFDAEEYLPDLAGLDLTEDQARELLGTLWGIMKAFVELGFGLDSIHRNLAALSEIPEECAATEIQSMDRHFIQTFEKSAMNNADKED